MHASVLTQAILVARIYGASALLHCKQHTNTWNMVIIGRWCTLIAWILRFTTNGVKAAATSSAICVAARGLRREILNLVQFPCRTWPLAWLYCSCAVGPSLNTCCPIDVLVLLLQLFYGGIGFRKQNSGVTAVVQHF